MLLGVGFRLGASAAELGVEEMVVPLLKKETAPTAELPAMPETVSILSAELWLNGRVDTLLSLTVSLGINDQVLFAVN